MVNGTVDKLIDEKLITGNILFKSEYLKNTCYTHWIEILKTLINPL